ncbi:MAG: hypothetical protein U0271_48035, partial [Polyangiaceae bacterium]
CAQSWWKPYGTVYRQSGGVFLEHHSGVRKMVTGVEVRETARGGVEQSFAVETWLGTGDADFIVASLHPFEASTSLSDEKDVVELPTVRFGDP